MASNEYEFTSESVAEGHPDKICDQISDAVLDAYLAEESENRENVRVGCECLATTNVVVVAGEVRGPESLMKNDRIEIIVRDVVREIGYEQDGFHHDRLTVHNYLNQQSSEIAAGVDVGGAGDQGLMFGYAVDESAEFMPAPIYYSHAALRAIRDARKRGALPGIGPDGKIQLTVGYRSGKPVGIATIVLSHQHDEQLGREQVREILEPVVFNVLPDGWLGDNTTWHVNPTGKFVRGGPDSDAGLTGRKIIVDTYGGAARHGGGAFSGKDPTKVDRSAAYAARYLAKNIVAAGLAGRCSIQISYAIGVAKPVAVMVDTHNTGAVSSQSLQRAIFGVMDLTPEGIRRHLDLLRPIYRRTAAYGHFGRMPEADGGFSWERTDLVDEIRGRLSHSGL